MKRRFVLLCDCEENQSIEYFATLEEAQRAAEVYREQCAEPELLDEQYSIVVAQIRSAITVDPPEPKNAIERWILADHVYPHIDDSDEAMREHEAARVGLEAARVALGLPETPDALQRAVESYAVLQCGANP